MMLCQAHLFESQQTSHAETSCQFCLRDQYRTMLNNLEDGLALFYDTLIRAEEYEWCAKLRDAVGGIPQRRVNPDTKR